MANVNRQKPRNILIELCQAAPRFRFFQAVRLLSLSAKTGNHTPTIPRPLRFSTPLSLAFPASEIMEAESRLPLPPISAEAQTNNATEPDPTALQLTVGFMGLTGPSGVLPTAYTEMLIERRNVYRDTTAHRFFDLFSHRAVSLFYQAWRKHRFYLAYEAGDRDRFTRNLLDLTGMGLTQLQSRLQRAEGGIPDVFLMHFAGLLSKKPVSATNLSALIRGYFGVDAMLEQFVGQWITVPHAEQTCLGKQSCVLGESAFAGERIWDRQTKIRVKLGPLSHTQFSDFLPGQAGAVALAELVQFCVGQSLACDLTLRLKRECIPAPYIANKTTNSLRLGYNAWLHSCPVQEDPEDAVFTLLQ